MEVAQRELSRRTTRRGWRGWAAWAVADGPGNGAEVEAMCTFNLRACATCLRDFVTLAGKASETSEFRSLSNDDIEARQEELECENVLIQVEAALRECVEC